MDDIPWHLVAIVFITFAIWIKDRIREASEWRRQRKAEKKAAEFARRAPRHPPQPISPYLAEHQDEEEEEPKTFRELFEVIQQQVEPEFEESDPTPEEFYEATTKAPPPLPGEIPSVDYSEIDPTIPTKPLKIRTSKRRSNRRMAQTLHTVLRDNGKLRSAIILKEVLGEPKALQD